MSLTVPADQDAMSDPIPVGVLADTNPLDKLVHVPRLGPRDVSPLRPQTSFLAPTGDHTADQVSTASTQITGSRSHLSDVDTVGRRTTGSVATPGDSITDGYGSTASANHHRPDRLVALLRQRPQHARHAALNARIRGTRVPLKGTGAARADARGIRVGGGHGHPRTARTAAGRRPAWSYVSSSSACSGAAGSSTPPSVTPISHQALPAFGSHDLLRSIDAGPQATAHKTNLHSPTEEESS
ncbi:hypothetical protein [Streptomyces hokutonensis]|uniref:hypothetical protein n=1 Tax=Streptomyces hokutonensis TaxID=1306990 RepID=UPI003678115F